MKRSGIALISLAVASCEVVLPLPASRACAYNYECLPIGQRFEQSENVLFLCRGAEGARRCEWGLRDEDHDGEIAAGHSDDPAQRDCDDRDERRSTGRAEVLDGVDNDCDGMIDEDLERAGPVAQRALFDSASGYRIATDRASGWAAFHPDQRQIWLGESITDTVAPRALTVPAEFATSVRAAAVVRSGQRGSSPLLVALSGTELSNEGGAPCARDYLGVVLATQTPSVIGADWRWSAQRDARCNRRHGALALARLTETPTTRSLLAVWQQYVGADSQPNRCQLQEVRGRTVTIDRDTQLSVSAAEALYELRTTGTRLALRENGDGTVLLAFARNTAISVFRLSGDVAPIHVASTDDSGLVVDDLVFAKDGPAVLAYSARRTCAATEASIVVRRVETSAMATSIGPPSVVASGVRLAALDVTSVPRVVDVPFARLPVGASPDTSGAIVTWIETLPSGAVLRASRVWRGDGAAVDAAPMSSGSFADNLLRDERGAPSLTSLTRDGNIESWFPSSSGQWNAVRWQPQPLAARVY